MMKWTGVALATLVTVLSAGQCLARPACLGVRHTAPNRSIPASGPGGEDEGVSVGPFRVRMASNVSTGDSLYIMDLIAVILPSMLEIVGEPIGLDLLTIGFDPGMGGGAYYDSWSQTIRMDTLISGSGRDDDRDGRIDEDGFDGRDNDGDGRVDEDPTTNSGWDETFIHELTHAFQTDILDYESWLVEGMAEAGQYFVATRVSESGLREVRSQRFDVSMAVFDLVDRDAGPLYGGSGFLAGDTPDANIAYRMAGSMMILPMMAEIAAGRSHPHPLNRVTRALLSHNYEAGGWVLAVDEAWSAPIDGVWPPSRWIRARAIPHPTVGDGLFLHVVPLVTGLNPLSVYRNLFFRTDHAYESREAHGALVFTDTAGRRHTPTAHAGTKSLPPGAYRLDVEESTDGKRVQGKTWILNTPGDRTILDGHEGTAVIFVGRDGYPVDLPDVTLNGRILERVPGGLVVAPSSRFFPDGALTFKSGDRVLGTVTLAGPLSRVVPLFVDDAEPAGMMSWEPYHPVPGGDLTVRFRPDLSILDSGDVFLSVDNPGSASLQAPLATTDTPGVLSTRVKLPGKFQEIFLGFKTTGSRQGGFPVSGYHLLPGSPGRIELVRVEREGTDLRLTLTGDPDSKDLRVYHAAQDGGPWIPDPSMPSPDPQLEHAWRFPLMTGSDHAAFVRIALIEGFGERILHEEVVGASEAVSRVIFLAPFPNPSPDGVRWIIELDTFWSADLQIFDMAGRRVHGPESLNLAPGRREIRWNGLGDGRRLSAGTYMMRLSGDARTLTRRVILVPDRPN